MSKTLNRRLTRIESQSNPEQIIACIHDGADYRVEGKRMTEEQFNEWQKTLPLNTNLQIVSVVENKPELGGETAE